MVQRIVLNLVCLAALAAPAAASPITYVAYLSGAAEIIPVASPGTGIATLTLDDVSHVMDLDVSFQDLLALNTAARIHVIDGPGDAITGDTLGPAATLSPFFIFFPRLTTAGSFHWTFGPDGSLRYNQDFITAAGSFAQADAAFFLGVASGNAYFNINTLIYPGGEIRGFFQPVAVPEPGTLMLLGGSLASLLRMRRRRA
jgi:hypothetical protein